ncbi:MAG: tetratricopeptide repeat protein [Lentisphaeria bacterium]|nr:tetratricopeptide repeat protein [Lentisphaeria bacterium]
MLIILLAVVFALTAVVMKFYTPKDKSTDTQELQSLRERQEIQILLGQAYFLMSNGDYVYAENTLNRLFEKSPNNILALQMQGQIYFNTARYAEAENTFRKLISINPENASNYNNLGQALAAKNDLKNAIVYLKRAIEIAPEVVMPYFNLAELYLRIGDKKAAIESLRIAFEVALKNRTLILNLSAFSALESEAEYRSLIAELLEKQLKLPAEKIEEDSKNEQN